VRVRGRDSNRNVVGVALLAIVAASACQVIGGIDDIDLGATEGGSPVDGTKPGVDVSTPRHDGGGGTSRDSGGTFPGFDGSFHHHHEGGFPFDVFVPPGHDSGFGGGDAGQDSGTSGGQEAGHDTGGMQSSDAGSDASNLGAPCNVEAGCGQNICATPAELPGTTITSDVCTRTCCTHDDCPEGFSCLPTTGGNFCVERSVRTCSGSACRQSCCYTSDCTTNGDVCGVTQLDGGAFDFAPSCVAPGLNSCGASGAAGTACATNEDCQSGVCSGAAEDECEGVCASLCCSSADCSGGAACEWGSVETFDEIGVGVARQCQANAGGSPAGAACTSNQECASLSCLAHVCVTPCCTDDDCSGGDRCRPATQAGSMTSVLLCQP
jgi:hypothetical protein